MYTRTKFKKPFVERDLILSLIKQGIPFYEIAAQFDISISELSDLAEAKTENEKLKSSIQIKNAIISMHKEGKSHQQIAALTKLDLSLINKTLSDYFQRKTNPAPITDPVIKNNPGELNPGDLLSFTDEEREIRNHDLIAAYQSGMSVRAIAEKYNINRSTLYNILRANGESFRKGWSEKKMQHLIPAMIADFQSGIAVKTVAEKYGLSKCSLYSILKSNGESFRKGRLKKAVQHLVPGIIADFQSGLTVKKIAEKHKLYIGHIYAILKANGITIEGRHKKMSRETTDQAIADFKAGLTVAETARKNNISLVLVYKLLKLNNIPTWKQDRSLPRKKGYKKSTEKATLKFLKIKELFESGTSLEEIAAAMNIQPARIRVILRENGIVESKSDWYNKMADEMASLFKQGVTRQQISERFNKNISCVTNALRKRGFTFLNEQSEKIIDAFQSGKTIDEVASEFKLTRGHVKTTLRKAGVPYLTRNNENKQEIGRLYKENIKICEIARILNIHPASVITNLIKQKLLPVNGSHVLKRKLALEEYQNGNTDFQKLSASYNIRLAEVKRICTGNTKPSRNEIEERTQLILELYHEGKRVSEIKQITGLPKSKIWRALSNNGIHSNDFEILFKENCKKIFPLIRQQKTIAEISCLLNVGQNTVKRARKIYFDKGTKQ